VRASLNFLPWKLRKPAVADLQAIYRAATVAEAEQYLEEPAAKWKAYPSVSQIWRRNWYESAALPTELRRLRFKCALCEA
jgi:putative transposase